MQPRIGEEIDMCCGNCCDKSLLSKEERAKGAIEFAKYLQAKFTEDCSDEAIEALLNEYLCSLV